MTVEFRLTQRTLNTMRIDLLRPHQFALERVGFMTAGAMLSKSNELSLLEREYVPVDDEDYLRDRSAGAVIGPNAMRKGLQRAYGGRSALIHVHMHGDIGKLDFSRTDLASAAEFVPTFFNVVPQMPHGIMVLNQTSARCLLWFSPSKPPIYVDHFVLLGAPCKSIGG